MQLNWSFTLIIRSLYFEVYNNKVKKKSVLARSTSHIHVNDVNSLCVAYEYELLQQGGLIIRLWRR